MAREDLHFRLRIPEDLKARVEAAATENHRSMTAEIISRLEESFAPPNQALLEATLVAESLRHNLNERLASVAESRKRLEEIEDNLLEREEMLRNREDNLNAEMAEKLKIREERLEEKYRSLMGRAERRWEEAESYATFTIARERQFVETIKALTGVEPPTVEHLRPPSDVKADDV